MTSRISPTTIAVFTGVAVFIILLLFGGALIGDYALTTHYVNTYQAHLQQLQIKAAIPECRALRDLAAVQGSHGNGSATYGQHLESAIRKVYDTSGCKAILSGTYTPPR